MKKLLLFAAVCATLVACSLKDELTSPLIPGKPCTLTASINPSQSPTTKITPDLENVGTTLAFKWEKGDKVTISNASGSQEFTVIASSISSDGQTADFEGKALTDMSSYKVTYGDSTATTITYREDTFKPIASGTGVNTAFTIDSYYPVLGLTLTGAINVTSIKYYVNAELKTTLDCGKEGIDLTSTAKKVYFPVTSTASTGYGKLEFCNSYGTIKEQSISCAIDKGNFIAFSTLDVRGYIKLFLEDGETEANTNEVVDFLSHCDEGTTCQLVAKFFPENIPATNVTWSSDREDILTVSNTGLLTKMCGDVSVIQADCTCNITCATSDGSHYSATMMATTCFAAGTRIAMADGSTKKVEDIVEGDLVRTFDHEAGCISSAKVCLTYKGETQIQSLDLSFASGKKLTIVGTHDLLLENTRKYVRINSDNVASYVGKRFYNAEAGTWDELVSYTNGAAVDYYCIYSAKHLNCVAEGLLTCPDDVDHNLNIYELDANLKADAAQLADDIAKYGLFDLAREFPELAQYKEAIEDLGGKYVYIAIGKGLVPENHIEIMKAYWTGK